MTEKEKDSFILRLYLKYYNYLRGAALIFGANPADVDDFVQDTFIIAMKKVDVLMKSNDHIVWLVKVLENCIRNHRRLHANRFNRSLEDYSNFPAPEEVEPLSHILPAQLSDSEKKILTWRFEENIDYKEMSRRLDTTEAYCRIKLCRLIIKCRKLMEK